MAERPKELPDLSVRLDQAILDPLLTNEQLLDLCDAGRLEGVRAICCTPDRLPQMRERLGGSGEGPRLISTIGFPFGALPADLKRAEAEWAAAHGAQELDAVPDFHALANGDSGTFAEELASLCDLGLPVRVVLDMVRLTEDQLNLVLRFPTLAFISGARMVALPCGRCFLFFVTGFNLLSSSFPCSMTKFDVVFCLLCEGSTGMVCQNLAK